MRSTKTSKEAPGSLQEPFTPRLATLGRGQGRPAPTGRPGGRNGRGKLTPDNGDGEKLIMFPGAHAQVYYNSDGEPLGWDNPGPPDPPGDDDENDYFDDEPDEDDEDDDDRDE